MGIIIAKFRKKTSTYDVLTKLESEIVSIEDFQKRTQQTQRKIVFRFVLLALLIYIGLALLLYLYFSQISQNQKLIWTIPLALIAFPLVIWLIKKFLTWYYNRKLGKNEKKLVTLKEKKKQILENVMETETYKIAKQILDKFGNEPKKPIVSTPVVQKYTPIYKTGMSTFESTLRQRNIPAQSRMRGRISFGGTPEVPRPVQQQQLVLPTSGNKRSINMLPTPGQLALPSATTPLVRSILPRDRSALDKMVDYLVGDGPSNRYALICQKCCSHNGMALKEEFEYLAFHCGYCSHFNPARKKRPSGPKFNYSLTPAKISSRIESSDSERNSENDSDSDVKPEELKSDSPDIRPSENISEPELQQVESEMEIKEPEMEIKKPEMKIEQPEMKIEQPEMEVGESNVESGDSKSQQDTAKIINPKESGDTVNASGDVPDI